MSGVRQRLWLPALLAGAVGAALILLMARTVMGHAPLYDELLHVLAARGWLAEGAPVIADGIYSRAWMHTGIVAASMDAFGDTLVAARLPSLLAAALLIAATGTWIARRAGFGAGLFAAVALCLLPDTLRLAVFVRFYTVHALLVAGIAMLVFAAVGEGRAVRVRWLFGIAAALLVPFAWHLQPTTAIAVAATLAGGAAVLVFDHQRWVLAQLRAHPLAYAGAFTVLAAVGSVALVKLGFIEAFREVPLWAAWAADSPHFYLVQFTRSSPLLWPLLPVATVLAFRSDRRIALFCVMLVGVAFVLHSLAAAKHMRYVYYTLPFMAALLGLGVSNAMTHVTNRTARYVLFCAIAGGLILSQEGQMAARLLVGRAPVQEALPYTVEPDWSPLAAELRAAAEGADRVVTSNAMKSLYYMGRYDYELNVSIVAETDTQADFGRDERTGRQAIGSVTALESVLAMSGVTLLVLEEEKLGDATGVPDAVVGIIHSRCTQVESEPSVAVQMWRCG